MRSLVSSMFFFGANGRSCDVSFSSPPPPNLAVRGRATDGLLAPIRPGRAGMAAVSPSVRVARRHLEGAVLVVFFFPPPPTGPTWLTQSSPATRFAVPFPRARRLFSTIFCCHKKTGLVFGRSGSERQYIGRKRGPTGTVRTRFIAPTTTTAPRKKKRPPIDDDESHHDRPQDHNDNNNDEVNHLDRVGRGRPSFGSERRRRTDQRGGETERRTHARGHDDPVADAVWASHGAERRRRLLQTVATVP